MLFALFCLLLFSPCLAALVGGEPMEASHPGGLQSSRWLPDWRRRKRAEPVVKAEETSLAEGFVLRSFPKGISQRRVVIQDIAEGVRMTIAQVRLAVLEAAKTVRAAYQSITETKADLIKRLAEETRIAIAHQIVRDSRASQAAAADYADACSRLRWSEVTEDRMPSRVAA